MDLTQGFIARLLERGGIGGADRERGRFRSFLLGALNHYIANEAEKARAQKRGGGVTPISLDVREVEEKLRREPADMRTPESEYIRRWALAMLDRAVAAVRARYVAEGKSELFERLLPTISGGRGDERYRAIGAALGMSEDAVKMAASRLRKRYREQLRALVAETVTDPSEIDDELRSLIEALR